MCEPHRSKVKPKHKENNISMNHRVGPDHPEDSSPVHGCCPYPCGVGNPVGRPRLGGKKKNDPHRSESRFPCERKERIKGKIDGNNREEKEKGLYYAMPGI